jgi:dihydrofolate reductase
MIIAIVACDLNGGIGYQGRIPWCIPEDLVFFRQSTEGHSVWMGRKTWDSLNYKPLPRRENVIVSRKLKMINIEEEVGTTKNIRILNHLSPAVVNVLHKDLNSVYKKLFVIGGTLLYQQFFNMDLIDEIWMTRVNIVSKGDTFFPRIPTHKFVWHTPLIDSKSFTYKDLSYDRFVIKKVSA